MTNLFVRQSPQYRAVTRALYGEFFRFLQHEQEVMTQLTELWHPFAHSLYSQVNVSINPNACVQVSEEKINRQGSIENDMAVSAGEALLASYLGLVVFVAKTGYGGCLPLADSVPMLWRMMYFSPRMQRLTLMLFQVLLASTSLFPVLSPHAFLHPLAAPNALLAEPPLEDLAARRRFFLGAAAAPGLPQRHLRGGDRERARVLRAVLPLRRDLLQLAVRRDAAAGAEGAAAGGVPRGLEPHHALQDAHPRGRATAPATAP